MNARPRGMAGQLVGRPVAKAVVAIAVVVLVTGLALQPTARPIHSRTPGASSAAEASLDPTFSPRPTEPAGPTPTPEPWEALVLDPALVTAEIEPSHVDAAGVAVDTRFTVRSLRGIPAVDLARGVRADPPLDFEVVPGATDDVASLIPAAPLQERTTYRLELTAPDGSLGGSWAFRTQRPLRIVSTIPGDEVTGVPINTGIEVTFDQDGSTGLADRFRIEPEVDGRLEQHGRTWAFVPAAPLALATAYRVTVEPGVAIQGSAQVLEEAVTFRFETEAASAPRVLNVTFAATMTGVRPGLPVALPAHAWWDDQEKFDELPDTVPLRIYRLGSVAATLAAARTLNGPDRWLRASGVGLVDTTELRRIAAIDAPLQGGRDDVPVVEVPVRLDVGAYLVEVPGVTPTQQIVQVGNLAAYALSTETDGLVWLNDLRNVGPVAGASVRLPGGAVLGTTDANGLARFPTPDALRPSATEEYWEPTARLITITTLDGRWLVAPLGSRVSWLDGNYDTNGSSAAEPENRWWLLFETDRQQFWVDDVIHAWGMVRSRDDGSVPRSVELRLVPDEGESAAAVVRVPASPNARGMFVAEVPVRGLPRGAYVLELLVDGRTAMQRSVSVAVIRKPNVKLEVTTDRHAYLRGDTIQLDLRASFFDGSSVPAFELRVRSGDFRTTVTTDATGAARVTLPAVFDNGAPAGVSSQSIHVNPVRPEEGEVAGEATVAVFTSNAWIEATSSLSGTTLVATGSLSRVDFPAVEASHIPDAWDWPSEEAITGGPLAGRPVQATVTREREVRTEGARYYDYIEKRVLTSYEYRTVEERVGTFTATTRADGTFRIEATVPSATDGYAVTVRSSDPSGRLIVTNDYVQARIRSSEGQLPPYLVRGFCGAPGSLVAGLDTAATVTLHDGDGRVADEGRFLYLVASRGLREAAIQPTSTFSRTLGVADLPGFTIRAVQVTTAGYVVADAPVEIDVEDLQVDVELALDRGRYAPGERVTVAITTRGPDGRPIAADVVLQGVDEKLYAIGAARDADILNDLHRATSAGFLQSFASHRVASRTPEGGCGATGGERDTFGDVATFQLIRTGPNGRGTASFELLDDLTSWRLSALALADGFRAGQGTVQVPVGLPFFVESVLAPEYLVGDEPVLRVRGYGDALSSGDPVTFTVTAQSLGVDDVVVRGRAFDAVRVPLPALPVGDHRIRIAGSADSGARTDAVVRVIRVVESRLAGRVTRYAELTDGFTPEGGDGFTSFTVMDAGRGALLDQVLAIAGSNSLRFDSGMAAELARRLLVEEFGFEEARLPSTVFDASRYEQYGIGLLPYASADPRLTSLAALVAPAEINAGVARAYLREFAGEATSEGRLMALAGLAGLGEDVLEELRELAADAGSMTIRESLWLALGLAAVGDENAARELERRLLAEHGQRLGPWVRLEVGSHLGDTIEAASLLLLLSSRLGEPFAKDVAAYLTAQDSWEHVHALERVAWIRASLDRMPREPGRFSWTLDGERHEVELRPGAAMTFVLTSAQRAGFSLERLAGELAVVSSWTGREADVPTSGPVTIRRTVTPLEGATESTLVRVSIDVAFQGLATEGCWLLTDLAPSGLAPIERFYLEDEFDANDAWPWEIDGQRVTWCASPRGDEREFVYLARVVSPGSYAWEPAIIQAQIAPELGDATAPLRFRVE